MFRYLFVFAWILFVPAWILGALIYLGHVHVVVAGALAAVAGLSLPAVLWFVDYSRMSWVRQGGVEYGPLSAQKIGSMFKAGKLSDGAEIRRRWTEEWKPFTILTDPPPRLSRALFGAILGVPAGLVVGFILFGNVRTPLTNGLAIQVEWIVEKPRPSSDPLHVAVIREGAAIAGDSGIPVVNVLGRVVQATDKVVQEHNAAVYGAIDNIRLCGLAGAVLVGALFAAAAQERHRILYGERAEGTRIVEEIVTFRPAEKDSSDRISLLCSGCGKRLRVPLRHSGKMITCPECSSRQQVPPRLS